MLHLDMGAKLTSASLCTAYEFRKIHYAGRLQESDSATVQWKILAMGIATAAGALSPPPQRLGHRRHLLLRFHRPCRRQACHPLACHLRQQPGTPSSLSG